MAVLATDDFNRANANPIGAPWAKVGGIPGDFQIVSNAATPTTLASDGAAVHTGITWPNDQYCQGKVFVTGSGSSTGPGLALRGTTASETYYRLSFNAAGTGNVDLWRAVAATYTNLWNRTATFTTGDTVRFEIQGAVIRVFINGVQVGADFTDGSPIASGSPGLSSSSTSTTASVDDWVGGDFTASWVYGYSLRVGT
jgi:hypothetical protein